MNFTCIPQDGYITLCSTPGTLGKEGQLRFDNHRFSVAMALMCVHTSNIEDYSFEPEEIVMIKKLYDAVMEFVVEVYPAVVLR